MAVDNKPVLRESRSRRDYLKGAGVLGAIGIAGCIGDTSASGDRGWPPQGNTVEFAHDGATPDDLSAMIMMAYSTEAKSLYPDGIDTVVSANPSGEGIPLMNRLYNGPGDGSVVASGNIGDLAILERTNNNTEYVTEEMEWLLGVRSFTRCVQVSHHSTSVKSHWDWDWDTFIDNVIDENLKAGFVPAAPTTYLPITLIEDAEPRLSRGDIQTISYPGGGEVRSAILRGEIDMVTFSFGGNYPRGEIYKTQFVFTDDRFPTFLEGVYGMDEDAVTIQDTSLDSESGKRIVDLVQETQGIYAPPATEGEALETHIDVLSQASQSDNLANIITESLSPLAHNPIPRDEMLKITAAKIRQVEENMGLIEEIFSK